MAEPPQRTYSRAEMMEILGRASDQGGDDGILHEDLVEAAREAGLDPESVERAAAELADTRMRSEVKTKLRDRRRALFRMHLGFYGFINGLLVLLNLLTTAFPWSLVPVAAWGFWLVLHFALSRREPSDAAVERVTRRERRRRAAQERRAAKKRARSERQGDERARRQRRQKAGKEFELAMEEGVTALLSVAAKKIEAAARATDPGRVPDTEFNRYVARARTDKGAPAAAASKAPPTRGPAVRVAPPLGPEEDEDAEAGDEAEHDARERTARDRRPR